MKHTSNPKRFSLPNFRDPLVRLRALLLGAAALIVVISSTAVFVPLSSNPTFCGKACHNMNPEYQTWQRSSHAKITCTACHVQPNFAALVEEKIVLGIGGLVRTITGKHERPINAENVTSQEHILNSACERCHTNENRKFTFTKGIYINHLAHKKAGIQCTICHNRVTHRGAEKYEPLKSEWKEAKGFRYKNFITMDEGCRRCHSSNIETRDRELLARLKTKKRPPSKCRTCHTRDFENLPIGHDETDWRGRHPEVAGQYFKYCMTCHDAGKTITNKGKIWCTVCHDDATVEGFKARFSSQQ